MFEGLYNALPERGEVLRRSEDIAHALRKAQEALGELSAVVATVPGAVRTQVAQAHRQLGRHAPSLHQSVVQAAGYEEAFFKPQTLENLRYWVLECGVDVTKIDRSGYTPLSAVANEPPHSPEQEERIKFLIQRRVNVNSCSQRHHGMTPLHLLIVNNNIDCALCLIGYTKDTGYTLFLHLQDANGDTSLLLALKKRQSKVVFAILHEAKASHTDIGLNLWNVNNESAIDCAINMDLNVNNESEPDYIINMDLKEKIIVALLGLGAQSRKDNKTALHALIANNHETIALSWIKGAIEIANPMAFHSSFRSQDANGNTSLLLAIKMMSFEIVFAILDKMKRYNTDIGLNVSDKLGKTALDYAYEKGVESIIIALLCLGATRHAAENISFSTGDQNAFLVPRNLSDLRALVLSGKVDIHSHQLGFKLLSCVVDETPHSPDQEARIEFLLQLGVDVNRLVVEEDKSTLLHFLIAKKNKASILSLIHCARKTKNPIDFCLQNAHRDTSLLLAVKTMQPEIVFAILNEAKEHKTDIGLNLLDINRRTAFDCAVILGEVAIIKALIELEAELCSISNNLSLLDKFDGPSMIKPILESVHINPDEEHEDAQGVKISLYKKCLENQRKIPTVFGSHLYNDLRLMPLPPWRPYPYMPPLYPHMQALLSTEEKKKAREMEEKDRKYMMPPPQ